MPSTVPESGEQFLRDYLYVDTSRVRSLLAQLYEGVPEQVKSSEENHKRWQAGLRGLGAVAIRETGPSSGFEETRALSDLHLSMFEDAAEQGGFLRDLSEEANDPRDWKRGRLRKKLVVGDLIRVTAPTRIIDPRHVTATLSRQESALGGATAPTQVTFAQVNSIVQGLYGSGIVVRSFPAGIDNPECNFSGTLLDDPQYIEPERSTLFARHGVDAQEWTIVAHVSRVPDDVPPARLALHDASSMFEAGATSLDRGKFEEFLSQIVMEIERTGLSEAPRHPAITVAPLAVYRTLTPASTR